jgi:hypothetical protein
VIDDGTLSGIITDRDIYIALGYPESAGWGANSGNVATREMQGCRPDTEIHTTLAVMRRATPTTAPT